MYIDTVVASGLVIVLFVCVMATYLAVYAYKNIKKDVHLSEKIKPKK